MCLLGRPTVTALQLVARLHVVSLTSKENVEREFPKLFSGLGKMEGMYSIALKTGSKLFPPSLIKGEGRIDEYGTAGCNFKGGGAN